MDLFSSGNPGLIFLIAVPVILVVIFLVVSGMRARKEVLDEEEDRVHPHETGFD